MTVFLIIVLSLWTATNAFFCLHMTAALVRWIKEEPASVRVHSVWPGTNITAVAWALLIVSAMLLYKQVVNP